MNRGVQAALLFSCLSVSGCTSSPQVKVRSLADPAAAVRSGDSVALARGQLMLGNVGLALEGFRKAQRDNPYDVAALQGIGDCYSAMSRFDLAQSNYEAALALSPRDPKLLLGLAAIYEREGKTARAMIARAEALTTDSVSAPQAMRAAPKPIKVDIATVATPEPVPMPRPSVGSITVELPAARPAAHLESTAPAPSLPELTPVEEPRIDVSAASAVFAQSSVPLRALPSVRVELPLADPLERIEASVAAPKMPPSEATRPSSVTAPLAPERPMPAPLPRRGDANAPVLAALAPRLERLSRGEVALITNGQPMWRSSPSVRTASGTTVRWVALASAPGRPNVRILNAARSQGLAASARIVLSDRGWRKLAIGDAPSVLRKSVVLYPKDKAALGRRLAAQFGVAAQAAERDDVVLVLGRDAVDRVARTRRS